jgi:hypothetical protein
MPTTKPTAKFKNEFCRFSLCFFSHLHLLTTFFCIFAAILKTKYAVFKESKNTHWYVFFRVYKKNGEDIYQVRYIANNHTVAQYLETLL